MPMNDIYVDCRLNSIGVGNENVIPDAQLSAYLSRDLSLATQARFHDSSSGWCGENDNSWIQVDTGLLVHLTFRDFVHNAAKGKYRFY